MKNLKDKIVVITGAASGIGLEMGRAFAAEGSKLVLADINAAGLEGVKKDFEAKGKNVYTKVVDVAKKEQVKDLCDKVYEKFGRADVLCNNAAVAWAGKFEDWTLESWEQIININLWSVIYGCHYFYPRMIKQGGGHIVNTASGAALNPLPMMSAYCTTKFAVEGFSETLRAEAGLHNIGVTSVCPGIVKTNIFLTGKMFSSTTHTQAGDYFKKVDKFYEKRNYTPDRVASKVVKAVKKNTAVLLVCPETYLGDLTHRLSRSLSIIQARQALKLMLKHT